LVAVDKVEMKVVLDTVETVVQEAVAYEQEPHFQLQLKTTP
jgi:hypothetical protein|tara:strand:+ start:83 stop:205 length:123 start_codon:yes stop_codon:yes gene_type:complete